MPLTRIKSYLFAILVLVSAVAAIKLLSFSSMNKEESDETFQRYFNSNYKIFSLPLPEALDFAGEPVPLNMLDIREKFDRELLINTYWQSQTLLFHKRAHRWFPIIEPILAKNGVPDDFKYLTLIESGLMNVVSPAGATGFWQILKDTGTQYGLEINGEVDERYHVEKSTEAACKYLKEAYKRYGNWTMAAASYNMGMNGLDKQVRRQKTPSYYDLLLNEETSRYVFRILAAKEIISQPNKYGFYFRQQDLYPPFQVYYVSVDSTISDFADFSFSHNINYKTLKMLNPWLRDTHLPNRSRKSYQIALPKDGSLHFIPMELLPAESDDSLRFSPELFKNDSI
jgi:membrane-bound lytic murein transglycosylase D